MGKEQGSLKPVDVTDSSSRAWDMAVADQYIGVPGL
jgi:hypothetical protein